jgi:hypothetical protein
MHRFEPLSQKAELEARIKFARKLSELKEFDELLTKSKMLTLAKMRGKFPPLEVPRRCK